MNPKSEISTILPVQKSEIECKTVKLKMIDSSNKIELGQTKWRTKIRRRLILFAYILIQRLHNKATTKLSKHCLTHGYHMSNFLSLKSVAWRFICHVKYRSVTEIVYYQLIK